MTCKEVEKWIPLFLRDDLDTDDLREFMEHIDKCEECREELSIQFLVQEGMARLESMKWLLFLLDGFVLLEVVIIIILLIVL